MLRFIKNKISFKKLKENKVINKFLEIATYLGMFTFTEFVLERRLESENAFLNSDLTFNESIQSINEINFNVNDNDTNITNSSKNELIKVKDNFVANRAIILPSGTILTNLSSSEKLRCYMNLNSTEATSIRGGATQPTRKIYDESQLRKPGIEKLVDKKLIQSILSALDEPEINKQSANKILLKYWKFTQDILNNKNFLRILRELEKPYVQAILSVSEMPRERGSEVRTFKVELSAVHEMPNSEDDNTEQNQSSPQKSKSASCLVKAFSVHHPIFRYKYSEQPSSMLQRVLKEQHLKASQENNENFDPNLNELGLSNNHNELDEETRNIESATRARRSSPKVRSQVESNLVYADEQAYKKASEGTDGTGSQHLSRSFDIDITGLTFQEIVRIYRDIAEEVVRFGNTPEGDKFNGTMNKQEPTINYGNPDTLEVAMFERNPKYQDNHFISTYRITQAKYDEFKNSEDHNIGMSKEERDEMTRQLQLQGMTDAEFQAHQEANRARNERILDRIIFGRLPKNARISNSAAKEAEELLDQKSQNPNMNFSQKQLKLLARYERNKFHRFNIERQLGISRDADKNLDLSLNLTYLEHISPSSLNFSPLIPPITDFQLQLPIEKDVPTLPPLDIDLTVNLEQPVPEQTPSQNLDLDNFQFDGSSSPNIFGSNNLQIDPTNDGQNQLNPLNPFQVDGLPDYLQNNNFNSDSTD